MPTDEANPTEARPSGADRYDHCGQITIERTPGWPQTIQIALISDQPDDPLRDRTVLVYHPGGPGISAVNELLTSPPDIDLARYAILTWDGATSGDGTGACGGETVRFLTERTPEDFAARGVNAGDECQGGFGNASDIGAWAAADELEQIRTRLAVDRFDVLAISYGTAIAEAYLWSYPQHVRRAVLDAPIGLQVPWRARIAAVGNVAMTLADELALACVSPECRDVLDGVPHEESYETLRQAVLSNDPSVGSGTLDLTPIVFDEATLLSLRSEDFWEGYGTSVTEALAGDGSALFRVAEHLYLDVDRNAYYRSLCADIEHPTEADQFSGGDDPLVFAYSSEMTPCVQFPRGVVRPAAIEEIERPPTLIFASTRDVLAPAALLQASPFLRSLGEFCISDITGHTTYGDPASRQSMLDFLTSESSGCPQSRR